MNDKIYKVIDIAFKILPIDKKQVLLYSCLNQYNDNPKYVAEKLHELAPDLKLVWATGVLQDGFDIPQYFTKIKYGTIKYYYMKNRSAIVVDNGTGIVSGYATGLKRKLNLMRKNKKQINVSTWHGTPFKYIGADAHEFAEKFKKENYYATSDILILGSRYENDILAKITNNTVPIYIYGNPRNDLLLNESENLKNAIKKKLGMPKGKRIILFAPTYRDDIEFAGILQMQELDVHKLCECFSEKFGGEWVFVLRFHQIALQVLKARENFKFSDVILDGNKSQDMSEYLLVCDALITDFSSSLYDVLYTKKPCFLYAPDYDIYVKERGLYMSPEELPFSIAKTAPELYNNILDFDKEGGKEKITEFIKHIGGANDGQAAMRTATYILDKIK